MDFTKKEKKLVYMPIWQKTRDMIKEISTYNMDMSVKTVHIAIERAYIEMKLKQSQDQQPGQ